MLIDEQAKYFQSWLEFLEASCGFKIPVLTAGMDTPEEGPWIRCGRRWDNVRFVVSGQEIHGEGSPLPNGEKIEIENASYGGQTNIASISYDGRGLTLAIDPYTVKYLNYEVDGNGDDKRPNPLWLLLSKIDAFFLAWDANKADRFYTIFRAIKHGRLEWLESQISYESRDIERLKANLEDQRITLMRSRAAQTTLRSLSKEKYEAASANWQNILESIGEIDISNTPSGKPLALTLKMPSFEIDDVPLGPFLISLNLDGLELEVESLGDTKSIDGHHHPHVSSDGDICWGSNPRTIYEVLNRANPFEILFCVADFLKTSYTPNGAYRQLNDWNGDGEDDTWHCDWCDERHSDDDACPMYCGECENNVPDWDEHHTCHEHYRCWNERELSREHRAEDSSECPECRRVRIAEEVEELAGELSGGESDGGGDDEPEDAHTPHDQALTLTVTTATSPRPPGYDDECECIDCSNYRDQPTMETDRMSVPF